MCQRKQRVVLNGQHSSWTNVETGVPSDLFLEHYSCRSTSMSDGLTSSPELLADDNSLFSVDQKINSAANDLNSDLIKIRDWDFQWKIRLILTVKHKLKR